MKIDAKICRLFLCVMGLMLILPCGTVLAQEEKVDFTLVLAPGDYYPKVTPGEEKILYLEIRNNGNKAITNIRLSSTEPDGWDVQFKPMSIDNLGTKSFQTIDVNVKPASNAARGEYQLTLIAEANDTRRVMSISVMVETATSIWLWIGIVVAALVAVGFIVVYRYFGRE